MNLSNTEPVGSARYSHRFEGTDTFIYSEKFRKALCFERSKHDHMSDLVFYMKHLLHFDKNGTI